MARDNYLPHLFSLRGERLVFSHGVWTLAIMAGVLLIAVRGNTQSLIPLFAIGVFIGFTLSQSGLVVHWLRHRPQHWQIRVAINSLGALATGASAIIFLLAKFIAGAWVVVLAIPLFMLLFRRISAYYRRVAKQLALGTLPPLPTARRTLVIVPLTTISRLTAQAVSEALSLGQEVIAVSVRFEEQHPARPKGRRTQPSHPEEVAEQLQRQWRRWHPQVPLHVLRTEYTSVVSPIVQFVDQLQTERDDQIVVLIPVLIPDRPWHWILHNHLERALSAALRSRPDVIVARAPYRLGR